MGAQSEGAEHLQNHSLHHKAANQGFAEGPPQCQRTRRFCLESVHLVPSLAGSKHLDLVQDVLDAWTKEVFRAEAYCVMREDGKWLYVTFGLWGLACTSGVASSEDVETAKANEGSQEREGMGKEQTELMVGVGKG